MAPCLAFVLSAVTSMLPLTVSSACTTCTIPINKNHSLAYFSCPSPSSLSTQTMLIPHNSGSDQKTLKTNLRGGGPPMLLATTLLGWGGSSSTTLCPSAFRFPLIEPLHLNPKVTLAYQKRNNRNHIQTNPVLANFTNPQLISQSISTHYHPILITPITIPFEQLTKVQPDIVTFHKRNYCHIPTSHTKMQKQSGNHAFRVKTWQENTKRKNLHNSIDDYTKPFKRYVNNKEIVNETKKLNKRPFSDKAQRNYGDKPQAEASGSFESALSKNKKLKTSIKSALPAKLPMHVKPEKPITHMKPVLNHKRDELSLPPMKRSLRKICRSSPANAGQSFMLPEPSPIAPAFNRPPPRVKPPTPTTLLLVHSTLR